jgi:hypothetical protein
VAAAEQEILRILRRSQLIDLSGIELQPGDEVKDVQEELITEEIPPGRTQLLSHDNNLVLLTRAHRGAEKGEKERKEKEEKEEAEGERRVTCVSHDERSTTTLSFCLSLQHTHTHSLSLSLSL